jgi:diaminopimelate epimerase
MKDVKIPLNEDPDGIFLDTGSPHLVKIVEDPDSIDILAEGKRIRYSERYPEGTNVNFCRMSEGHLYVRTYERGVEDETLSCGTGVTASAIAAAIISGSKGGTVRIETRGGILQVSYKRAEGIFTDIWLEGPAEFVFEGTIKI